ncbi:MAG: YCF48-related protein [Bacteroidetes bacterium]|nr:YCF48-related protein [Bacteroidota bacterium]
MRTKKLLTLVVLMVLVNLLIIPYGCKHKEETTATVVPKMYAWVVGNKDSTGYALILRTTDGGETWQRQGEGSAALQGIDLYGVAAADTNIVFAAGSHNAVLKTLDGGKNWIRIAGLPSLAATEFASVSVAGTENVWISGGNGVVLNSKNGGITWTLFDKNFFHNSLMQGIHAVNAQTVYVVGGFPVGRDYRGFIGHTADGGQTWDSVVLENNYNRNEWIGVKSSDVNNIVVYGGKSHYAVSTDGGLTWKNDSVLGSGGGGGGADINCLTMLDAQTWWGAFDYDAIYITTNGGALWTKQVSAGPPGMWLFGIDYFDRNHAIICAPSSSSLTGKIITTSDGGTTWRLTYSARTWLNKVSSVKSLYTNPLIIR